jgi:hypothetical protein
VLTSGPTERWQKQKRACLILVTFTGIAALLCVVVRCVPILDDWISGPARPVRALAEQSAKAVAAATANEYPIIVTETESEACQNAQVAADSEYDDAFYVLFYSERSRSVCLTNYVHFPDGSHASGAAVLSENMGTNYGRKLTGIVRAVPFQNHLAIYPQQYLSLLHWRAHVVFPLANAELLNPRSQNLAPNAGTSESVGVELDYQDLRAIVARRHNITNRVLTSALGALSVLMALFAARIWTIYRRFQSHCQAYGFAFDAKTYVQEDLNAVHERARRIYLIRQQEAQEQLRAESFLRHSLEEAKERLEFFQATVRDDRLRIEIEHCLQRGQLDEMQALLQQRLNEAGHTNHDERLTLLLESLKPYCTPEEFESYFNEAFVQFGSSGFRPARDFVVRTHDELKLRARQSEQDESGLKPQEQEEAE